jgi:hypothetical protein
MRARRGRGRARDHVCPRVLVLRCCCCLFMLSWLLLACLAPYDRSGGESAVEASVPHDDLVHFRHDLHRELRTAIASDGTVTAKDLMYVLSLLRADIVYSTIDGP